MDVLVYSQLRTNSTKLLEQRRCTIIDHKLIIIRKPRLSVHALYHLCMCEQRLEAAAAAAASYEYHHHTIPGHFMRVGLDVCDNDRPPDDAAAQDKARRSLTASTEPRQSAVTVCRTSSSTNNDDADPTSPETAARSTKH